MRLRGTVRSIRNRLRVAKLENAMTPREVMEMIERHPHWASLFYSSDRLARRHTSEFQRQVLEPQVRLFRRPDGQRRQLVIGFADVSFGMMIPTPLFLQALGDLDIDVLAINDPSRAFFHYGVSPDDGSLLATLRRLDAAVGFDRYETVMTYGCSMGGLAGVRAGLMLGVDRAIGVAGSVQTGSAELPRGLATRPAFDPICCCPKSGATSEVVLVHSAEVYPDVQAAARVKASFPQAVALACNGAPHNIFLPMVGTVGERAMLHDLFNSSVDPSAMDYSIYRAMTAPVTAEPAVRSGSQSEGVSTP